MSTFPLQNTFSTYTATLTFSGDIVITKIRVSDKVSLIFALNVRNEEPQEHYYGGDGICQLDNGDTCYLYRIYDDPAKDKIKLSNNVSYNIRMIHR